MKLHSESEALLSEPGNPMPGDKLDRSPSAVVINEKFDSRKAQRQFSRQYAHSYAVRLWTVRPKLEEAVRKEWPGVPVKKIAELCEFSQGMTATTAGAANPDNNASTATKANTESEDHGQHISFRDDVTVAVIGTVFKYQPEKPSILQELSEDNPMVPVVPKVKYISDKDTIQLEDETTRVQLVPTQGCGMTVGTLVNGVICAVKGKPNMNGRFEVKEVIFPTPTSKPLLEQKLETEMVFISGLELGHSKNSGLLTDMLFDYLQGLSGCPSEIENNLSKLTQVFFVGNMFSNYKNSESGKDQSNITTIARKLDEMFDQISQTMQVFIIPGENDPSEPMLPQIPIHRCVFPLSSRRPTFKTLSNPARIELPLSGNKNSTNLDIILSSGQNVDDAIKNSETTSPLEMAQKLLRWGHLCPTAPDTIPLHPGVEEDVFVLDNLPHIFAVGNQMSFDSMEWKNTRIFTIPKFSETGTVVLVKTDMDVIPMKFGVL